jgi:hypothetical protein
MGTGGLWAWGSRTVNAPRACADMQSVACPACGCDPPPPVAHLSPELAAFERDKGKRLLDIVQPALSVFVRQQVTAAFESAVAACKQHCESLGMPDGEAGGRLLPVTHPAHPLYALHRALGWRGCPTDASWPQELAGYYGCVPLPVHVPREPGDPGMPLPALAVGWGVPMGAPPFIVGDALDGVVVVVEAPIGNPLLVRSTPSQTVSFPHSHTLTPTPTPTGIPTSLHQDVSR